MSLASAKAAPEVCEIDGDQSHVARESTWPAVMGNEVDVDEDECRRALVTFRALYDMS